MKTGINFKLEVNLGGLFIAAAVIGVAITFATFRRPPKPKPPRKPVQPQPSDQPPAGQTVEAPDLSEMAATDPRVPHRQGIFSQKAESPLPRLYTPEEIAAMREKGRAEARAHAEQLMQRLPPQGRAIFARRLPIIESNARALVEGFWRNLAGGAS